MNRIRIFAGSVYGAALETARELEETLEDAGYDARLMENPQLQDFTAEADQSAVLMCTSTTGEGELPPTLQPLYQALSASLPIHEGRPYGLIVLGDRSYGDTYCGAGEWIEALMTQLRYQRIGEVLRIDAMETPEPLDEALPWVHDWARRVTTGHKTP